MKRRDFITRKKMKALRGNFACAALLAFVLPAQADPKWLLPDGIKSVEVNGYEMAYQEMGSGVPLVLVHGAMTHYRSWSQLVRGFAQTYRVVAVVVRRSFRAR